MAHFRILSLDGGGIRGLLSTIILQRLTQQVPGWLDTIDLIAGTSSGGLIALGLAHQLNPQQIRDLYEHKGAKIFDDSWLDDLIDLGRVVGAEYDDRNLTRELKNLFGDTTTLNQLQKKVLIATFDLDNEAQNPQERSWKPKLFHNFPGADSDAAALVYKVGMYTCAAPSYFPSVDGFIDGGVFANNPSMCAIAQSQDTRAIPTPPALTDLRILSVGTGYTPVYIRGPRHNWGFAQWAKPLISLMFDGVSGIADYQCRQVLGANYHRLSPAFAPGLSIPLDAVDRVPELIQIAESVDLSATVNWLRNVW